MTKSIDVALLRLALRLVHCIQKERGSSLYCSACKGGYSDSRETFEKAMKNARHDVDKVISSWLHQQEISSIRSSLVKIRSLIDSQDESDDELIFHRIFACFNILNSSIVSDFIIPQVPGKYHKSIIQKQHKRNSLSMDLHNTLSTLAVPTPDSISTPEHSNPSVHSESSPASFSLESQHLQLGLDSTLQDLLNLLHIFVQLKESAGVRSLYVLCLLFTFFYPILTKHFQSVHRLRGQFSVHCSYSRPGATIRSDIFLMIWYYRLKISVHWYINLNNCHPANTATLFSSWQNYRQGYSNCKLVCILDFV